MLFLLTPLTSDGTEEQTPIWKAASSGVLEVFASTDNIIQKMIFFPRHELHIKGIPLKYSVPFQKLLG